jgi:hypothetical protein
VTGAASVAGAQLIAIDHLSKTYETPFAEELDAGGALALGCILSKRFPSATSFTDDLILEINDFEAKIIALAKAY